MSLIDKLLQMDKARLMEMPTKKLEMPRLSELTGESFNVTCKAIVMQIFSVQLLI